ncbi:MAG: hypothetical protein AB8I08_07025 [Sandaracinaceae bacterium]
MTPPRLLLLLVIALGLSACGGSDTETRDEPIVIDPGSGDEQTAPEEEEPVALSEGLVVGEDACETDADCVPAGCCHASACVGSASAPDCSDTMCTADCQFGTLDCGGSCLCHEGRCAARLSEAPELPSE